MKAVHISRYGGPEVLEPIEVPQPVPGPGQVVIAVAAAGVNRTDINQRSGRYLPQGKPEIPGLEVSGHIHAVGPEVHGLTVGDPVVALLPGGGYAEYVLAPATHVLPVPVGIDVQSAAGLPEVAATVVANLLIDAEVGSGDIALVHGGTGGIGTMAVQLLHALGVRVAVTVGSDAKAELARSLGADIAINYRTHDFARELLRASDGHGADVILDVIGGDYLAANIHALARRGRLVIIGTQGGRTGELPITDLMAKRATIIGTTLRARSDSEKTDIMTAVGKIVWPCIESGRIAPVIDRTFDLRDAAAAHSYLDTGAHTGKVLLLP